MTVVITLVLALLFWRLYSKTTKRSDFDEPGQIPQDTDLRDSDVSIKDNDHHCPCGLSDPHYIVHSREGSVIAKDLSFLTPPSARLVESVPKKNSSQGAPRLTGLGITFDSASMIDLPGPVSQISGMSRQGRSTDMDASPVVIMADELERRETSIPPPAYVRDVDKV